MAAGSEDRVGSSLPSANLHRRRFEHVGETAVKKKPSNAPGSRAASIGRTALSVRSFDTWSSERLEACLICRSTRFTPVKCWPATSVPHFSSRTRTLRIPRLRICSDTSTMKLGTPATRRRRLYGDRHPEFNHASLTFSPIRRYAGASRRLVFVWSFPKMSVSSPRSGALLVKTLRLEHRTLR